MARAAKSRGGRPPRAGEAATVYVRFRLTEAEEGLLIAAAGAEGIGPWCRRVALESAHVATSGRGGKVRR